MAEGIFDRVRKFKEKVADNYHDIEDFYNKELKSVLSQFGRQDHTPEEYEIFIGVLNEALAEVDTEEAKTVKDGLKQAKKDALEKFCRCQDVLLRKNSKKRKERPKAWIDRGSSNTSLTDSRVMSELADVLVVQPTDASKDKEENNTGKDME